MIGRADWQRIVDFVRRLPFGVSDTGKMYTYRVTIEEIKPTRSTEQNARYWALLTAISQQAPAHMGGEWYAPEAWHKYCKRRFLGVEPGPFGEAAPKSTRKLTIGEFAEYMTEIEVWAQDEIEGFEFGYDTYC